MWLPLDFMACATPFIAKLSASVPPEVNTTSSTLEAPKKSAPKDTPEADAVALAAKKAAQQTPRPTTNMRGETLGLLLNVAA